MSRRSWQTCSLLSATVLMGLMAGFFADWTHTIMPGLGATDDHTFVNAFHAFDRAIMTSGPFMIVFMGALVSTGAAAILCRRDADRAVPTWVGAAFALYAAAFLVTMAVHEPLNLVIRDAGDRIADPSAVRAAFDEGRWAVWNIVRAGTTTCAFGALVWALVVNGRPRTATRSAPGIDSHRSTTRTDGGGGGYDSGS